MTSSNLPFSPGDQVVAYLRDSGGQNQELSTDQQEQELSKWAVENNLIITQFYKDAARTGTSTDKRDAFKEMIAHFHERGCRDKGVIIWSFSRFARNMDDAQYYEIDLRKRGYHVYSINDDLPDTPQGRLIKFVYDMSNQLYSDNLSIDIRRGLRNIVTDHNAAPGHLPLGFKREQSVIGNHRNGTPRKISSWLRDEDMVPIIQDAWKMRSEGCQISEIHKKYHLYTNMSSYNHFFRNPIYIGELHYQDIVLPNYVEPMIRLETWSKVQEINAANTLKYDTTSKSTNQNHPRRLGGEFLLSGLLYCSRCGNIMNGKVVQFKGYKRNEYYCCTGASVKMVCDAPLIPRIVLENKIIESLTEYILDPNILKDREINREKELAQRKTKITAQIKQLESKLKDNKRRAKNLTTRIENDPNAPAIIIERISEIEQEIKEQQNEMERLESQACIVNVRARTPHELSELSEKLVTLLSSEDPIEKKTILRFMINRIDAERNSNLLQGVVYFYDDILDLEPDVMEPLGPKILMPIG
jgi:DNA invertase Pin-like site-specific DNA recombinase